MKITEKQIEEMAKEYAESENSAYTNDYYGFINGFKKALTLYGVSQQRELLIAFSIHIHNHTDRQFLTPINDFVDNYISNL